MFGKEYQVLLTTLSQLMAAKTDEPILHVKGLFNGRIEIVAARSYPQGLHRARVPSNLINRYQDWE